MSKKCSLSQDLKFYRDKRHTDKKKHLKLVEGKKTPYDVTDLRKKTVKINLRQIEVDDEGALGLGSGTINIL